MVGLDEFAGEPAGPWADAQCMAGRRRPMPQAITATGQDTQGLCRLGAGYRRTSRRAELVGQPSVPLPDASRLQGNDARWPWFPASRRAAPAPGGRPGRQLLRMFSVLERHQQRGTDRRAAVATGMATDRGLQSRICDAGLEFPQKLSAQPDREPVAELEAAATDFALPELDIPDDLLHQLWAPDARSITYLLLESAAEPEGDRGRRGGSAFAAGNHRGGRGAGAGFYRLRSGHA